MKGKKIMFLLVLIISILVVVGCGQKDPDAVTGKVKVDGSSTVYPITEAIAEEFMKANPRARVSVAYSGTGGGFKKFIEGETDINDASREVTHEEKARIEENDIEMVKFEVAYDGISVIVNPANDWVDNLTVEQLNQMWKPGSDVDQWSDLDSDWPDTEIKLYGPGPDSGTFSYFTEEINGEEGAIRSDFTPSENDNVLVQGIAGDEAAIGYFGFAYYKENKNKLDSVAIDGVKPAMDTIATGEYTPLSRPLYLYVNKEALQEPAVKEFVRFYLNNAADLVSQVGYVPLPDKKYQEQLEKIPE